MRRLLLLLRGRTAVALRPGTGRRWAAVAVFFSAVYGGAMGSFAAWHSQASARDDLLRVLVSAAKVPVLGGVAFAVTVPLFLVLGTLAGVRSDARRAVRAAAAASAGAAVVLASLAPLTLVVYAANGRYDVAVAWNGLMFAVASVAGGLGVARCYAPLWRADRRHRPPLLAWAAAYVFTAVQVAWVLRPFVGNPAEPVAVLRHNAWGNAYVVVFDLLIRVVRG